MIDRKGARNLAYRGNGSKWDKLAGGRPHEHFRQVLRILLERWIQFQDNRVVIAGREDRRHLPRSERIVKGRAYLFGREAECCRLLAVDVDNRLRTLDLQIRTNVLKDRQPAH